MFAEAEEDFVDILFSFFTLPLGTIARLSGNQAASKDTKFGSLTSLYQSVVNMNAKHLLEGWYKDLLVNPRNPSASICQKLKVNLNKPNPITTACQGDSVFVKLSNFIITDNLTVIPVTLDTSMTYSKFLGVENINLLEQRTMHFGVEEFLNLLMWSLLTNNPLTNLVLVGGKPYSSCPPNSTLSNSALISSNSGKTRTIMKVLVQKSNKKVICAQVENLFVELLFSFLTLPLGAVMHLTKDCSSPSGISNLYNSISYLGDGKFLKYDDVKTKLLCPKVVAGYHRVTDFLPIYETNAHPGHFLKEQAQLIVSDDLQVIVSPSIATFSKFNTLGFPDGDMEVVYVSFGELEAVLLLKASLTSTSALTDFLNTSKKKPMMKSST